MTGRMLALGAAPAPQTKGSDQGGEPAKMVITAKEQCVSSISDLMASYRCGRVGIGYLARRWGSFSRVASLQPQGVQGCRMQCPPPPWAEACAPARALAQKSMLGAEITHHFDLSSLWPE
jgi:hypothetical protein